MYIFAGVDIISIFLLELSVHDVPATAV